MGGDWRVEMSTKIGGVLRVCLCCAVGAELQPSVILAHANGAPDGVTVVGWRLKVGLTVWRVDPSLELIPPAL